jgi:hypothetical protein
MTEEKTSTPGGEPVFRYYLNSIPGRLAVDKYSRRETLETLG